MRRVSVIHVRINIHSILCTFFYLNSSTPVTITARAVYTYYSAVKKTINISTEVHNNTTYFIIVVVIMAPKSFQRDFDATIYNGYYYYYYFIRERLPTLRAETTHQRFYELPCAVNAGQGGNVSADRVLGYCPV